MGSRSVSIEGCICGRKEFDWEPDSEWEGEHWLFNTFHLTYDWWCSVCKMKVTIAMVKGFFVDQELRERELPPLVEDFIIRYLGNPIREQRFNTLNMLLRGKPHSNNALWDLRQDIFEMERFPFWWRGKYYRGGNFRRDECMDIIDKIIDFLL